MMTSPRDTQSYPKILLFGADGQVGWELRRSLLTVGEVYPITRKECDLTNLAAVQAIVSSVSPDIIVNAAAYTAVDKAESEPELARSINVELPKLLAHEMCKTGGLLVDYSTDYIFDGSNPDAYTEDSQPNPLSVYGVTKLAGLQAIEQSGCRHLVFRVSWVYGARGNNFIKTILRLAKERDSLNIVSDQIGVPTPADLIADVTALAIVLLNRGLGEEGVYNLVPDGECSWYEVAKEVVQLAQENGTTLLLKAVGIAPIASEQYPTPAVRPKNSRLTTGKLKKVFGVNLPEWQIPLKQIVRELIEK